MNDMADKAIENRTPRRSGHAVLQVGALVFVSMILSSCLPNPPGGFSDVEEDEVFNVRASLVTVGDLEDRITLSGEVYATGRINVVPDTSGLLTKVLVNPGDTVSFNQIIAYVDPSRPGMSYAESPVRSKATGTVTAVPTVAGNQVSPQSVIAEVGNLSRLEVETRIPEKHLASLQPGLSGWITSRAYPDSRLPGRVSEVSPVVDPRSRTVLVTMVPDSTTLLRPGQSVTVNLILETRSDIMTVPAAAVSERRDGAGVFVVNGDSAGWQPVKTGANVDGLIEILDGLNPGDSVIIAGYQELTDGTSIRVLED